MLLATSLASSIPSTLEVFITTTNCKLISNRDAERGHSEECTDHVHGETNHSLSKVLRDITELFGLVVIQDLLRTGLAHKHSHVRTQLLQLQQWRVRVSRDRRTGRDGVNKQLNSALTIRAHQEDARPDEN